MQLSKWVLKDVWWFSSVSKKDGSVEVINTQGKDKILEKEARRVIEKLPKLIPGKQRDRPVAVIFSYPIVFKLN